MGSLRSNESFVRLFLGRLVTNAGDSMYFIATMWLVYELTNSPFYTGLAGFLVQIPTGLQFLTGPLVDRWPLRPLLVVTQLIQGVCVLIVPIAAWTGHLSVWLILSIIPLLTFINQFVYPAQSATLPRIVGKDQLVRANSLFSTAYQGFNLALNAASGVLIAIVGAVTIYLIDAVTFGIAVALFLGLDIPNTSTAGTTDEQADGDESGDDARSDRTESEQPGYFARLTEGISYVRESLLSMILVGSVVANFTYGLMIAALPAFASLRGGPEVYGLLMAAMAAGNLIGSASAPLIDDLPVGWAKIGGYSLAAVCWFGALTVTWQPAIVGLFLLSFVPVRATNVMSHSLVQSAVDDDLLGRVTSVSSSISTVTLPIGSLLGGIIAVDLGSTMVMGGRIVGLVFLIGYYLFNPQLRSLPSVVKADETALEVQ